MTASGGSVKNLLLAGLGVYTMSRERIDSLVSDLVERGAIKQGDAAALIKKLTQRAEQERGLIAELIHEQMAASAHEAGVVTKQDLQGVLERIERIERIIEK